VKGFQRDAAVTALDIAGIPCSQLGVTSQLGGDAPSDISSIFDDVGDMKAIEDLLILRDLEGEPEWDLVKKHRYPGTALHTDGL